MSDKTPKDEFDVLDDDLLAFPGAGTDGLTEEELAFTVDMSGGKPEKTPAESSAQKEDAVFSAMRRLVKRNDPAPSAGSKVDALAGAFRRLSHAGAKEPDVVVNEEPVGAEAPDAEKALTAEETSSAEKAPTAAAEKPAAKKQFTGIKTALANGKQSLLAAQKSARARKRQKDGCILKPAPVTIGRDLRTDEMLVYDSELDEADYTDEEDLPEMRDYLPIRFGRYGRVGIAGGILYALFVISVSVVLACVCWTFAADVLALGKEPLSAVVYIDEYVPEGDDPVYSVVNDEELEIQVDIDQVANELKSAGIINYKWLFKIFSKISHAETKISPGTYSVSTALDYRAIVTALQFGSGSQEITKVTFPEGYSTEQIFALLEENHICHVKDLKEAAADYEFDYDFLADLEPGDPNRLEGYLFPDTYEFYQGEDAAVALNRFLKNFNSKFDEDMRARAESLGYSMHEIITIASLIEKESANAEESPVIASVIYNRLNDGWKLGLDSTINYILGTSTFDLSYDDLAIDDPYNTYLYEGLPPGPICNPGLSSIEAALYPEKTNYWYWYAADGETHFFTNSDDFNAFAEAHPY